MRKKQNVWKFLPVVAVMALAGVVGCSGNMDDIPEPAPDPRPDIVRPPVEKILLTVGLEVPEDTAFYCFRQWDKGLGFAVVSMDGKGELLYRYPSHDPHMEGLPFIMQDSLNSVSAVFGGNIVSGADSLVGYFIHKSMMNYNICQQYQSKDGTFGMYDIVVGACRTETDEEGNISASMLLKHQTSQLAIRFKNDTGDELTIVSVQLDVVDNSTPFYDYLTGYFGFRQMQPRSGSIFLTTDKTPVEKEGVFTANISLFMADETALDGKAIRYTVRTNKGDYVYTKEGETYRKGNRYVENIKMKGR